MSLQVNFSRADFRFPSMLKNCCKLCSVRSLATHSRRLVP